MIPDDYALEEVSIGPKGAFQGARTGAIYIDMSTVSPGMSARVGEAAEEKSIKYLRAPVSGSTQFAESAALTVLASGPKKAYDRCKAIFHVFGQKCFHVGKGDEARYLKLLVNMMVGDYISHDGRGPYKWNCTQTGQNLLREEQSDRTELTIDD